MRIATFNVNGVNGRLDVLLRWLAIDQPDVVCLQELKAPQERFPITALERAGYGAIWHGQKAWNGVAILAKGETPLETRRGLAGEPPPGPRIASHLMRELPQLGLCCHAARVLICRTGNAVDVQFVQRHKGSAGHP